MLGVILSPRETYADVAARPRALGVLIITIAISAGVTFWFQGTEAGQQAVLDVIEQQVRMVESLGGRISDEQYDQMTTVGLRRAPYQSAAAIVIATPLITLLIAAMLLGVFNGIMGGNARFKQVFAVVAHSGVIWTLAALFNVGMGMVGGDATGAASLLVFFPMLEEGGFLARLLGYVDLFWLWGFVSIATGAAVLYRRRTAPIAVTLVSLYLVFGVLYAAVRSFAGA
jgi:hypothetical protein